MRTAFVLALLCLPAALTAGQFVQAYPAVYELVRFVDGDRQVLAGGELLLLDGRTERVRSGGDVSAQRPADATGPRVAMQVTARKDEARGGRLDLVSDVDIAIPRGSQPSEVEAQDGSYIQGHQVHRVSFSNRTWQPVNDPTPIEVEHDEDGTRYVLTIMFQPPS